MKMPNPNWEKIGITPLEISLRDQIGRSLSKDELGKAEEVIAEMESHPEEWKEKIAGVREQNIFNSGHAGETAAEYILKSLIEKEA